MRRLAHEHVADIAEHEELTKPFVPLDAEADVPFAGAESFVRIRRRRLHLEERGDARDERLRPRIVEQIVEAFEIEVAEAGVPAASLSIRLRRLPVDHHHARFGVEIKEGRGDADVEPLAQVAKRHGRVDAARGVVGAEVALIVARAELELKVLTPGRRLRLGPLRGFPFLRRGADGRDEHGTQKCDGNPSDWHARPPTTRQVTTVSADHTVAQRSTHVGALTHRAHHGLIVRRCADPGGSSNGRTPGSGPGNGGSSPPPPAIIARLAGPIV